MRKWLITSKDNIRGITKKYDFGVTYTNELVQACSKEYVAELKKIQVVIQSKKLKSSDAIYINNSMEEVIDHFEFVGQLATPDVIGKHEWDDYCFDGNFNNLINSYLTEMYDLFDTVVRDVNNIQYKLIFVSL